MHPYYISKNKHWLAYGLSLLFTLACLMSARAQNYTWAKTIGGTLADAGNSIVVDASGNVYTTGTFNGTVDFDPGTGVANLTSAGGTDIFVSKLDASGNLVWAKNMGGTSADAGNSIAVDASGNVYTTGTFNGTADFDPGTGTTNLISAGGTDIFISKLDASGIFVWAKKIGGAVSDIGYSIAIDASGNVYTTGNFQDTVDFDPNAGTSNLTAVSGVRNIFVSRLDNSGNFVWAKSMGAANTSGGTSTAIGYSIAIDALGNVYTTGSFSVTVDFDPSTTNTFLTSSGSSDIFVSKLDALGNFVWVKKMGSASTDIGRDIAVDASGNVYTTGSFSSTVDFDPGTGTTDLISAGSTDIFVSKLDASGNLVWAKKMGATAADVGYSIAVDASGNVYTTGSFSGTVDFDPSASTANLTSAGGTDIFVSELDASGNFIWAKNMGGTSTDVGNGIAVDASGNVYTTGSFNSTADFDPGTPTTLLTSAGSTDIFVSKLSPPAFQYRTTGAVTFASPTNWESSPDGTTWSAAASAPDVTAVAITIRNGHTATVGVNISLDQLTVASGGTLQVSTGATLTIADGIGADLTIQNGGTIDIQGTGTLAGAGGFTLEAGGTFKTSNLSGFNAIGLTGTETFTAGANYEFNGTALQTINNPTGISANNFVINNALGGKLSNDLTITNTLTLTLGDLDLNGKNITLNGTLLEDRVNNHIVLDNTATSETNAGGAITFIGTVTNTSTEIAGTGLYLQHTVASPANDYPVTVTRRHYRGAGASAGGKGIKRIYRVTGSPTGTNTTMRIYYASDELADVSGSLVLFRWQSGIGWKQATDAGSGFANGTNSAGVYVEATGINGFSDWTIGSSTSPLPITLLGLKGERVEGLRGETTEEVRLDWSTASEINNKGFEVEMSKNGLAYTKIAFVEGKGNSTTIQSYNHITIQPNDSYYRLKQVDFDGTFSYSPIVFVEGIDALKVYPNPNKGAFTISVGKDKLDSPARLLNAVGKEVWRGVQTEVHTTGLPTGIYFLHTTVAGKTKITKVAIER